MATPTINTTFKSFSIQRGYFVPSERRNEIVKVDHSTWLSITAITNNFYMTCKINGVDQLMKHINEPESSKWHMDLVPGDIVEFTVRNWEKPDFSKIITFNITENGPEAVASKGVRHSMEGVHKPQMDIQSKYRRGA